MDRMRKGVLPAIAIVAIVLLAVIVVWGIFIGFFVGEHETIVRSGREREIIRMINEMEWVKKVIPQTLEFSFYQSTYSMGANGGYFNPNDVPSYDCTPYWRVYDKTYFPDSVDGNLNKTLVKYLSKYASALGFNLPPYEINFQQDNGISVNMIGENNLAIESGIAKVEDSANFSEKFNISFFDMFDNGKEKFVDQDSILSAVTNSLGASCEDQKSMITSEIQKLQTDEIKLDIKDVQVDCNGHAAVNVLVRIVNAEKYPVYDYSENTTSLRNVQLKFYIVTGNGQLIQPETNTCGY
jgi:hypothetical protein